MTIFFNSIQHLFARDHYLIYIYVYVRTVIKTQFLYH